MDPAAHRIGSALCIASAIAFGAMAIFGKLAYDAGVGLLTLLFVRFSIAAPVLWIAALRRRWRRSYSWRRTRVEVAGRAAASSVTRGRRWGRRSRSTSIAS